MNRKRILIVLIIAAAVAATALYAGWFRRATGLPTRITPTGSTPSGRQADDAHSAPRGGGKCRCHRAT